MPTDRLAHGPWREGIGWQARRPSYGASWQCAPRGALVGQICFFIFHIKITVIKTNYIQYFMIKITILIVLML